MTIYNVTLIMNNTNYDGQYNIEVRNGGTLKVLNSSIITDSPYDVDDESASDYEFMFWVRSGANFTMKDSELHECGYNWSNTGLTIETDGVEIKNSVLSKNYYGIDLSLSSHHIISGNNISSNKWYSIYLYNSSGNNISGNNVSDNNDGIYLDYSSGNNITGNNASSNIYYGIYHGYSNGNNIMGNTVSNNLFGIRLHYSSGNNITGNNVSNNYYGIHLYYSSGNNITGNNASSNNWCDIILESSSGNNITGNKAFSSNRRGIVLDYKCSGNNITGNTFSNNWYGIYLYYSSGNNITGNTISSNNYYGVRLDYSSGNNITSNIFSNDRGGIYLTNSSTDNLIINCSILSSTNYDFNIGQDSHATAINTTFDKSKVYFDDPDSTLTVKWYMHVYVKSAYGLLISGATVDVTNIKNDPVEGSPFTTGDDGFVRWGVVTERIQNSATNVTYTPHNVTVTLNETTGYAAPEPVMDSSKVITVILDTKKPIADAGIDTSVDEDEPYIFDSSGSVACVGIINWTWDYGDGTFGYGKTPTHTYTSSGFYVVVLNVTDAAGTWDTETVNIFVNNVPPTADAGNDKVGDEGEQINFDGSNSIDTASDINSLFYRWDFGDGTIGTGKMVNHSYEDNGTYTVTLQVTDDDGASSIDSITVTINNIAPKITPITPQFLQEDQIYTLQVIATDVKGDTLTFSDNTTMFDIDPVTGVISFTPQNADVGMHLVNITVADDDGAESYIEIQIDVQNTNDAPIITSSPITIAVENSTYYYNLTVIDDDTDTLIYTLDLRPGGMSIDSNGRITWIPTYQQASQTFMVIVNVSDGNDFDTQTFSITVMNVNDKPAITSTPILSATEDAQYLHDVNAVDVDIGDWLIYSLDTAPIGMNVDSSTGLITWVPTNDQVGDNDIKVNVTDSMGVFVTQGFTITVANSNDAPVLGPIGPLLATEGETFSYIATAVDIDVGDTLTFSDDTDLFDINSTTGNITFVPSNDDVGIYTIKITVTDSDGAIAFENVLFTVNNVNNPPILPPIDSQTLTENVPFILVVTATDIDVGDTLLFLVNTTLFDINPYTGEISFTPINEDVGTYLVNITVKNEGGGIAYQTVNFTVNNVNDPSMIEPIGGLTAVVGKVFSYTVMATDIDHGDTLTFSDDTEIFDIDPNTGEISFTPSEKDAGVHYVTITVTDEEGGTVQTAVTFNVLEAKGEEPFNYTWILLTIIIGMITFFIGYLMRRKEERELPIEEEEGIEEPEEIEMELLEEEPEEEEKVEGLEKMPLSLPPEEEETVEFELMEEEGIDSEESEVESDVSERPIEKIKFAQKEKMKD